jgi:hypothetical protein
MAIIQYSELAAVARDLKMPGRTSFIDSLCRSGILLIDNLSAAVDDAERIALETITGHRSANGKQIVCTAEKPIGKLFTGAIHDAITKNSVIINLDL